MAHRYQRGCLRKESRKNGMLWMLRYYAIRPADGKKVQRTLFVGYVVDFPTQSDAWAEADRLHLAEKINQPGRLGTASFAQIARHYADNELLRLANTTEYCYHHIIDDYLVPRWGSCYAVEIKPNEVERWLNSLSKEAKAKNGLEWPTLRKMRNVMNLIYAHAQRQGLIPEDLKYNPVRPAGLGGARCKCTSDYEALILIPEQTFTILNLVPTLERTLILLVAVTALRISEALGLQWRDIDYENSQINVRRRWIRGNIDKPKSKASKAPVAAGGMASGLAERKHALETRRLDFCFHQDQRPDAAGGQHAGRRSPASGCCQIRRVQERGAEAVRLPQPPPFAIFVLDYREESRRPDRAGHAAPRQAGHDAGRLHEEPDESQDRGSAAGSGRDL